MCLIKLWKLLWRQQLSIMQQFGAFAFYTVVRWHELRAVLHISIIFAICMPKIIKYGWDLMKFWQKQVGSFFGTPCGVATVLM